MIDLQHYRDDRDYGSVYRLFTDEHTAGNIMNKPDHNDFQSFKKWLIDMMAGVANDFYVAYDGEEFVGVAYTYGFRLIDGHTRLTVAVRPDRQGAGAGAEITALVLRRLFGSYPLRKVFLEVYGDNGRSLISLGDAGLEPEAVLREYRFRDGFYEDLLIYSVTRERFRDLVSSLCPWLSD